MDPEALPPAENQNQVVLFDAELPESGTFNYVPTQKPQEPETVVIKFEPLHNTSIYAPEYTQIQNEVEYIADDLSNTDSQNQVVLFDEHEIVNDAEMNVSVPVPDVLADTALQDQYVSHTEKTEMGLVYDDVQSYKMTESVPIPPMIPVHKFEIQQRLKPSQI
jgi:hypothetical protein